MQKFNLNIENIKKITSFQNNEFNEVFFHLLSWTKTDQILNKDSILDKKIVKKIIYIDKKKSKFPIAYLLKKKFFYENTFFVNKNVLIPRVETELIVESIQKENFENYIDLCSGSGCLGISVFLKNNIKNFYINELESKAIKVAKKNLKNFGIKAVIIKGDFIEDVIKSGIKFNLITMNPPYISKNEFVDDIVKNNEPNNALFATEDGLFFYKKFFKNFNKVVDVSNSFKVLIEFGYLQKKSINQIIKDNNIKYNIEFKKDHFGNDRFLIISN